MGSRISIRLVVVGALLALMIASCARSSASAKDVQDAVRSTFRAENSKDIDTFLALWTDKGLSKYDVGSRKELEDPKSEQAEYFGSDKAHIVRFADTKVTSDEATVLVDAALEARLVPTLYRLRYELIKKDDTWLFDGFEFVGSPPPPAGTEVVRIDAVEYGFILSDTTVDGDVAFKFSNKGKQQHELALFKGPDGVDVGTAKTALQNLDGETLDNLPKGYTSDHLSFAEPGDSRDVSFEGPLPAGTYLLACFVPEGGTTEDREPMNPDGKPHIQLGMINRITVR